MAGIDPISMSNIGRTGSTSPLGSSGAAGGAETPQTNFADALKAYVNNVESDQQNSADAVQGLLSGQTDDMLPTVAAVAKADMSFKLLIGVRNKMIEAYKQTLNMQI